MIISKHAGLAVKKIRHQIKRFQILLLQICLFEMLTKGKKKNVQVGKIWKYVGIPPPRPPPPPLAERLFQGSRRSKATPWRRPYNAIILAYGEVENSCVFFLSIFVLQTLMNVL